MSKVEKNCKQYTSPNERRHIKRKTRRIRRRAEKRDPENAPTKLKHMTLGWSD